MNHQECRRRPQLAAGVELRSLPITPAEAFVLSRVDGASCEADIVAGTGMDREVVLAALDRLAALGAIVFFGDMPSPVQHGTAPPPATTPPVDGSKEDLPPGFEFAEELCAGEDLSEDVDLGYRRRVCVLALFQHLEYLDHYQLLGLDRDADRRAVKSAYYGIVSLFHPDRYFGKRLGTYKAKLEAIFARLTEAQEVLSRSRTRRDYDEFLDRQRTLTPSQNSIASSLHEMIQEECANGRFTMTSAIPSPFGAPEDSTSIVPACPQSSNPPLTSSPSSPPSANGGSRKAAVATGTVPERRDEAARFDSARRLSSLPPSVRKKALARQLAGATSASRPPPSTVATSSHVGIADELRHEFTRRTSLSRQAQVERYREAAGRSIEAGQWVAAANAMRIAAAIAPEDASIAKKLAELEAKCAGELHEKHLERARDAEKCGHLTDAAQSYERAARSSDSRLLLLKSAQCLLESAGDLKKAAALAKRVLAVDENNVEARVILARIYAAAGMRTSALMELERASGLAPKDASIRDLLKKTKQSTT